MLPLTKAALDELKDDHKNLTGEQPYQRYFGEVERYLADVTDISKKIPTREDTLENSLRRLNVSVGKAEINLHHYKGAVTGVTGEDPSRPKNALDDRLRQIYRELETIGASLNEGKVRDSVLELKQQHEQLMTLPLTESREVGTPDSEYLTNPSDSQSDDEADAKRDYFREF
jgi:hypothetical protein